MSAIITFGMANIHMSGNTLEKDSEGYTKLALGSFNAFNSNGEYYPYTDTVKSLLADSSILMTNIAKGYLYAENGHPKRTPGMTVQSYLSRIANTDDNNTIAHIKKLELVQGTTNKLGDKSLKVFGWIKPFGPHAKMLETSLATKSMNTAFSLRCLFRYTTVGGIKYRNVVEIVTYDFVITPGMSGANKFDTQAGVESDSVEFTLDQINEVVKDMEISAGNDIVGLESSSPGYNMLKRVACAANDSYCKCLSDW